MVKGKITDEFVNPIEADIEITDAKSNQIIAKTKSNKATGAYLFSLPSGRDYGITVTTENYFFHTEHMDIPESAPYFEVLKNIKLRKAVVGKSAVLNSIFFDHNQATLKSESTVELEKVVRFMKENKELLFEISGHTDNKGSWDYNMELSERRSEAVMNYLIEHGVAKSRLVYSGYGYDKPVATNDTDNGRQQNRRVEMLIIQNTTDKTKIPIVFKVQVIASRTPISTSSRRLQALEEIEEYYHKGMYKYAVGKASNLEEVQVLKERLKKRGYNQAFTVAFYNDTRIAMRTALKLLNR